MRGGKLFASPSGPLVAKPFITNEFHHSGPNPGGEKGATARHKCFRHGKCWFMVVEENQASKARRNIADFLHSPLLDLPSYPQFALSRKDVIFSE